MTPGFRARALAALAALATAVLSGATAAQSPPEVTGVSWCPGGKTCLQWSAAGGATEYRLYRGDRGSLAALADSGVDSCRVGRYFDTQTGATLLDVPPPGTMYWYVVTAYGPGGEGTAGAGASGERVVDGDACPTSTAGLAASYPLDEGTGTVAADFSGNGNDATVFGATWFSPGRYGAALAFDGSVDYVEAAGSPSLNVSGPALTISAWVNIPPATTPDTVVLSKPWFASSTSYPTYQYAVEFDGSDNQTLDLYFTDSGGTLRGPYSVKPDLGVWTHFAFSYDGATVRGYLDGAERSSTPASGSLFPRDTSLRLGVDGGFGQPYWGRLDEVRIYARALSQAEIQSDMDIAVGSRPPSGIPRLAITSPTPGENVAGTTVSVTYDTTGDVSEVDHVHFRLDDLPETEDATFDGVFQIDAVHVGAHLLRGYLARTDHSRIAGSDADPVSFQTVVDPADPVAPTVTITAPGNGATVSGTIDVNAIASDNVGVYGVQFRLDGEDLGSEDTAAPYSVPLDTRLLYNGAHTTDAVARDVAGNETTATPVGITVANNAPTDPAVVGVWNGPYDWPLVAIHGAMLHTGRILYFDDHTEDPGVQVWDPVADAFTPTPYPVRNLFCAGLSALADGRIAIVGGHVDAYAGIPDVAIFDPVPEIWSTGPPMTYPRWYPTATALPDGRLLVLSGASDCPTCNDPNGTHDGIVEIPEIYDPVANDWTQLNGASLRIPLYPHVFVLPDGRVLVTSTQEDPIETWVLNLASETWSVVDPAVLDGGSAVMYRPGKVLKSGSARNPDYPAAAAAATAYVLDMSQPAPAWRATSAMHYARTQHNLVALPDGDVLAVGGSGTSDVFDLAPAVYAAELWSPSTETWTVLASMASPRVYHSTALLLPDGRVVSAGGGRFGIDQLSADVFSPPYLFKGPRPVIVSSPAQATYGSTFFVGTPDAGSIAKVTLVKTGAVTHAFDQDQRFVELSFEVTTGGLNVHAPADADLAPPGYYMLFLVNASGVPSVAPFLQLPVP